LRYLPRNFCRCERRPSRVPSLVGFKERRFETAVLFGRRL
jgi:hypothetical protein